MWSEVCFHPFQSKGLDPVSAVGDCDILAGENDAADVRIAEVIAICVGTVISGNGVPKVVNTDGGQQFNGQRRPLVLLTLPLCQLPGYSQGLNSLPQ